MIKYILLFTLFVLSQLDGYDRKIALLSNPDYLGEHSFAFRLKKACENINWSADIWDVHHLENLKYSSYDFVICLVPGGYRHPYCKTYITIFHPIHHFFETNGYLRDEYSRYDGYLLTYPVTGDKKNFSDDVKFPYMTWYPTVHFIDHKIVSPSHLFYICCVWGNRSYDAKYRRFLALLDKQPYCRFYGREHFKQLYPRSYSGPLSFEGNHLFDAASNAGIALVLHSGDHLKYGLPSGRIFEAAASSCIIISDKNSFVKEHFGNSVLYIDVEEGTGKSIFHQIDKYIRWIYTHKTKALEMAKRSHLVYKEKFLLDDQVRRLGEFHDRLIRSRRPKSPDESE